MVKPLGLSEWLEKEWQRLMYARKYPHLEQRIFCVTPFMVWKEPTAHAPDDWGNVSFALGWSWLWGTTPFTSLESHNLVVAKAMWLWFVPAGKPKRKFIHSKKFKFCNLVPKFLSRLTMGWSLSLPCLQLLCLTIWVSPLLELENHYWAGAWEQRHRFSLPGLRS